MSSEPPEEPHLRSEPNILSPASPKPIHFPTPTNIPVLEMQMDVNFNQTEPHMSDPAMHNTEVRPDFWRAPNEALTAPADHVSPYSTGGEATQVVANGDSATQQDSETAQQTVADNAADSMDTVSSEEHNLESVPISISHASDLLISKPEPTDSIQQSSDPSVPNAEVAALRQDDSPNSGDQALSAQTANSTVDVQALLNTLQPPPAAQSDASYNANVASGMVDLNTAALFSPTTQIGNRHVSPNAAQQPPGLEGGSSPSSTSGLGLPPTGLPPRPPPQEQPLIHPNYVHSQHIRDYHPHASNPAFQPQHARSGSHGNAADPSSRNHVPPVHSPSSANVSQSVGQPPNVTTPSNAYVAEGQQVRGSDNQSVLTPTSGQNTGFAASPQNYYGNQYLPVINSPVDNRRDRGFREGGQNRPEDRPWDAEVQRKYDRFIEDERRYVSEGRWEQFPQGSRLFIGNLSSERVTKRDIFHVFHTYGDLAQISIKQAYGFVQFLRTDDCVRALEEEQGTQIRDKKIHLEVSKPQKNRTQNTQRRSRSPPGRSGSNVDRYVSGARGGNNRGNLGGYRSPSPRGYRDRYDDRYRRRSRSPDYNRGGRYRSPSPKADVDDDLPLPRRAPRDVPDVQIIVLDSLDRDFISWVEKAFSARGVRVDVLLLSPRLSEQAVIRRQIMEGVAAVVKLTRHNQNSSKIGLQIFDRRQGANNVKFEEYEGLDPSTAVELVLRAKSTPAPALHTTGATYGGYQASYYNSQPTPSPFPPKPPYAGYNTHAPAPVTYGQPPLPPGYPMGYSPAAAQGPPPVVPPNLQHIMTNLDPNNLQNLLSALHTPQSVNSSNTYANPSHPNSAAVTALQSNPALAGYLQQQQQQQQQQAQGGSSGGSVNMQEILARLGGQKR